MDGEWDYETDEAFDARLRAKLAEIDAKYSECSAPSVEKPILTEKSVYYKLHSELTKKGKRSQVFRGVVHNLFGAPAHAAPFLYNFKSEVDVLEIQRDNTIIGYELKGYRKKKGMYMPPNYYLGLDQALSYLVNPLVFKDKNLGLFYGSIFDYVYLVHPRGNDGTDIQRMSDAIEKCTPIGFMLVDDHDVEEIVKPKKNPFVNSEIQQMFLDAPHVLDMYRRY
ncbi:MAG: hypothetical protein U9N07_04940 [Euryarchaeota archaeon]|nr:hypothetical protein [Euryarchaeota archaeon]